MDNRLDAYLQELGPYLPLKGQEEILREIQSHILEKTESDYGEINPENLDKVISQYGAPQKVAAKYLEGVQIISPVFRKHLFLYSAVLFVIHAALTFLAWILDSSFLVFPFFYIPRLEDFQALFYLPMAFVYDFGLVALFLYFVTQKKADLSLPWPKLFKRQEAPASPPKPGVFPLLCLLTGFVLAAAIFVSNRTLFFVTIDFKRPESLFDPAASVFFSSLLLGIFAVEVGTYLIRFSYNSHLVLLIQNGLLLLLLAVAWNYPHEIAITPPASAIVASLAKAGLILWTVLASLAFFAKLIRVARTHLSL